MRKESMSNVVLYIQDTYINLFISAPQICPYSDSFNLLEKESND